MIFGLPALVGAGLIGTAAFGIAKLAGASTKTALLAGLGTFGGMAALGSLSGTAAASTVAGKSGSAALAGGTPAATELATGAAQLGAAPAATSSVMSTVAPAGSAARMAAMQQFGQAGALGGAGIAGNAGTQLAMQAAAPAMTAAAPAASQGLLSQAGDFIGNLSTAEKIGLGIGGATLLSNMNQEPQVPLTQQMPYTEEDYSAAKARQDAAMEGMSRRADYSFERPRTQSVYEPINPIYAKTGGLASVRKFLKGGINYLPSKTDHDEKDSTNYVRAHGYVEDGSGNGNKDEDTMLAQLADGEFVSRADAILGAGIMQGASPEDFKEMRMKGAKFFYTQQAQLKRIYDIVNGTDKAS
tara:strand:+ start:16080 stop:17150 length:1071 start_codon:yes stop_codon:yes gene_type:complete